MRRQQVKQRRRNEYVAMRNQFYSYLIKSVEPLPSEGSERFRELFLAFRAGWVAARPSSRLEEGASD